VTRPVPVAPTIQTIRQISLRRTQRSHAVRWLCITLAATVAGCTGTQRPREPAIDPDIARAQIASLLPTKAGNRDGWALDIFTAFEALNLLPTTQNTCAVVAVAEQESTFQVNPTVPGLPAIARREIDARAARYKIPQLLVNAALELQSSTGKSYRERIENAKTEKALSDLFDDFIGMVPLGRRLFADLNPVHTAGPMQVSIAFAEKQVNTRRYPYPLPGSIRDEVFTRRGGLYFGIAHLLDYPASYDDMLFRFADFNAGHYASRNAAFQSAVSALTKKSLVLDGDLLRFGSAANEPSNTELAVRGIGSRLDLSEGQIRADLELGEDEKFEHTRLYSRVFELADSAQRRQLPRAVLPRIRLDSPKITRQLTTEWFARRVNERYQSCLSRSARHEDRSGA
jgi:hypothetical protein